MQNTIKLLSAAVLTFLAQATLAQELPKLEIAAGQTFIVSPKNTLQVDTLIMQDNATIVFADDATLGRLDAKVAYIGSGCTISAKGVDGLSGKNGLHGARSGHRGFGTLKAAPNSPDGEDGQLGVDGTDAGLLEVYIHLASLGSLTIDTRGGNGGDGGSGGNGLLGTRAHSETRYRSSGDSYTIEVPGEFGGNGGSAGQGGKPGKGGNVLLVYSTKDLMPLFNRSATQNGIDILYQSGKPGTNGRPGKGGYDCRDGYRVDSVIHQAPDGKVALINTNKRTALAD